MSRGYQQVIMQVYEIPIFFINKIFITESLSTSTNQIKAETTPSTYESDKSIETLLENAQNKLGETGDFEKVDNLQNVRDELQNVIELMGPSTPHLNLITSSEGDIDDSYISTSIYSSVVQVKHVSKADDLQCSRSQQCDFISDTPRDISQISTLPSDSIYTESEEINVQQINAGNRKLIKTEGIPLTQQLQDVDHYKTACLNHYKSCPCRQYIKNLQQMATNRSRSVFRKDYSILQDERVEKRFKKVTNLLSFLKFKRPSREYREAAAMDLYTVNILQNGKDGEGSPPRRLVFDKINDIPRPETNDVATNTCKEKPPERMNVGVNAQMPGVPGVPTPFHTYIPPSRYQPYQHYQQQHIKGNPTNDNPTKKDCTKVDIYYFDHGTPSYFKTTDCPPCLVTELIAEKTEAYTSRFWMEFFGTVHIGFAFFTSFILQLLRFTLQSLCRPMLIGIIQLTSDYLFKPFLTVLFNAIIQPPLIFLYNIFTSLRDLMDPIAEGIGYFLNEIANLLRAIRLIDVKNCPSDSPRCGRGKHKQSRTPRSV